MRAAELGVGRWSVRRPQNPRRPLPTELAAARVPAQAGWGLRFPRRALHGLLAGSRHWGFRVCVPDRGRRLWRGRGAPSPSPTGLGPRIYQFVNLYVEELERMNNHQKERVRSFRN